MTLDVHVSSSPFEIYYHELPFLIHHEMLRLNVSVEISAVMNEL